MRYLLMIFCLASSLVAKESIISLPDFISQLQSTEFQERQAAMLKIEEWSKKHREEALKKLLPYFKKKLGPETRGRLYKLLSEAYISYERTYFGIAFNERPNVKYQGSLVYGMLIQAVVPDGPSARAGIKVNDVILAINDRPFPKGSQNSEILKRMASYSINEALSLTILRGTQQLTIKMSPENWPVTEVERKQRMKEFREWFEENMAP